MFDDENILHSHHLPGILSLAACALYIVETYMEDPGHNNVVVAFIEALVAIFCVDYVFQFLLSEDRSAPLLFLF